ncbi:ParB/RepB/Spo0J family partition protein [Undibacterium sp. RTI2.1]|uniref:ParB/RepB/Spo0J family partition protein n=1 Tax=unclassified Undibacterium TaxID=2630295 RepID=UPI002B231E21|nr:MULTISPECIES: ParB/RepB/Spo0J family partition protein [unclassified Undibacterium]MEB0032290.1 ParB/RepB/Spo0J family partition protein [Undibacterium sp. RTI2.1]MEB0118433.1 ParB/RepB/Spo0J family partition protein [Undibacterium sp. RTI2.2]
MKPFSKPTREEMNNLTKVVESLNTIPSKLEPAQTVDKYVYQVGQSYDVPINEIKVNPFNARRFVSESGLDELAISIAIRQDTAALGYLDESKKVNLIDGHRRLKASLLSNKATLRVEIRNPPESDKELYLQSRRANKEREDQTPLDDASAWKLLLEKGVFSSQREISESLNMDETVFSRTLSLSELPLAITRILTDRPKLHNLRMLDAIRKFCSAADDEKTEQLILEIDRNDLSSRDVDLRRVALSKGKGTRVRSVSIPMKYDHGASTLKKFEDKGKFVLEVTEIKDKIKFEALTSKINELVKETLSNNL